MSVEQYYFSKLHEVLIEIRDEMRALREDMKVLTEMPQPIIVKGEDLPFSAKEEIRQHWLSEGGPR